MSREEFKKFIESIGFKYTGHGYYVYKECEIYLWNDHYDFYNISELIYNIDLNDLTPLKKMTRCIKLKQLLR